MTERERLTTERRKIFARESLTLMSMTKDELRQHYNEIFDRLQEYEVAEENNQIIVPPCKVGDTVYVVYDGYVTCAVVLALYNDRDGGMLDLRIYLKDETTIGFKTVIDRNNYTFNDVYLTQKDAEKALEGMK